MHGLLGTESSLKAHVESREMSRGLSRTMALTIINGNLDEGYRSVLMHIKH